MVADGHIARVQKIGGITISVFLLFFPLASSAQVVIDEIMYDLPGADNNGEWIEITNTGSSDADFTYVSSANTKHWKLISGDESSGTAYGVKPYQGGNTLHAGDMAIIAIDPGTFLNAWPGWNGILFDVSATSLKDKGDKLTLQMPDGTNVNTVDYTSFASTKMGAGDGNSLQFSGGSWIAAQPTPGAQNATTPYTPPNNDTNSNTNTSTTTTTTTTSTNTSAPTSSYVAPPEPQIFADAGDNRTVIVAADTEFLGRAYNRKKETITDHIRFQWNFGDGRTAEGQSVLHHFEYLGRYAVVLNIAENMDAASDRIIVTAEPARLAFTALPDGGITIGNNAGRDLDLSGWIVRSFGRSFMVPKDSIILAGESLRIGEKTLGFRSSPETELDYPNGVLALQAGTTSGGYDLTKSNMPATPARSPTAQNAPTAVPADTVADQMGDVSLPEIADPVNGVKDTYASSSQIAGVADAPPSSYTWLFGVLGLAAVGGGAMVAVRRVGKREWDIVEESTE